MSALVQRARRQLTQPGAWIEARDGGYHLRMGPDRRARVSLVLDERGFRALIETPGLRTRPGGGWAARGATRSLPASPPAGRPGHVAGERAVMEADGRITARPANLGHSAVAWLASRKDQSGRPWLSPAEVAAGERLTLDAERAQAGPSMTMRWDALPRSGAGSSARVEPTDQALAAGRRLETALMAVGPRLRPFLVSVCVRGSALGEAERTHGLRKRQGRTMLKQALQALAEHYRIG